MAQITRLALCLPLVSNGVTQVHGSAPLSTRRRQRGG
jgi:hypothetical protein